MNQSSCGQAVCTVTISGMQLRHQYQLSGMELLTIAVKAYINGNSDTFETKLTTTIGNLSLCM